MKLFFLCVISFVFFISDSPVFAENNEVVTSVLNGKNYYHLKFLLSSKNIVSVASYTDKQFLDNGGQFEVLVKKNAFPISSPNCKSNIILRMPWTNPKLSNSKLFISEKMAIYKAIKNITNSEEHDTLDIAVELNPYVSLKSNRFELTQCNIFFRHARGRYISRTGNLR